ncbi:NAD(P)H-dependent oxidoreductase [Agarivorans sp.]|uniref:NAD(P)H-dependent oxidoreductase n=1 Tax=Agarivorans sp. TaxID=1872412 RepID=UPI003D012447
MKKVLVINANPKTNSLTKSLSQQYVETAQKTHEVVLVHIGELDFDLNLQQGYESIQPLEADLIQLQQHIKWAEHIVIMSPVWWGSVPAKFKGAIDRVMLPGFAFKYSAGKSIPEKLLAGKTSEIIVNMDTPIFWYKIFQGNVIYKHLKYTILDFTGIKNKKTSYFGPVISAKQKDIEKWHNKVSKLASNI